MSSSSGPSQHLHFFQNQGTFTPQVRITIAHPQNLAHQVVWSGLTAEAIQQLELEQVPVYHVNQVIRGTVTIAVPQEVVKWNQCVCFINDLKSMNVNNIDPAIATVLPYQSGSFKPCPTTADGVAGYMTWNFELKCRKPKISTLKITVMIRGAEWQWYAAARFI